MPNPLPIDQEHELSIAKQSVLTRGDVAQEMRKEGLEFTDTDLADLDVEIWDSIQRETTTLRRAETEFDRLRSSDVMRLQKLALVGVALLFAVPAMLETGHPLPWLDGWRWLVTRWVFGTVLLGSAINLIVRLQASRTALGTAQSEMSDAQARWRKALTEEGVLSAVLRLIAAKKTNLDFIMGRTEAPGLADLRDANRHIRTKAHDLAQQLVGSTSRATIGLAGPRGVGKSTILRDIIDRAKATSKPRPTITVDICVPRRYDALEFVVHLFRKVVMECRDRKDALDVAQDATPAEIPRSPALFGRVSWLHLLALSAGLFLVTVGVLATRELASRPAAPSPIVRVVVQPASGQVGGAPSVSTPTASPTPKPKQPSLAAYLTAADLKSGWMVILGVILLLWPLLSLARGPSSEAAAIALEMASNSQNLDVAAEAWSKRLAYQESHMIGWSSGLKGAGALEVGASGSTTTASLSLSLPDAVDGFRVFIEKLGRRANLFVGIDELDKMDPAEAQDFLNDIKVIFDTQNSHYLLTLSDSAMSTFARRGFPVRDVFDSSLDEVIPVECLTWHEALALVNRRVLRMPQPFIALCYSLSGGLPRDLLRLCRDLVRKVNDEKVDVHLSRAAKDLLSADLKRKRRAVIDAVHDLQPDETPASLWDLESLDLSSFNPNLLRGYANQVDAPVKLSGPVEKTEQCRRVDQLLSEMAAYLEYCSLVLEIFEHFDTTYIPEKPDREEHSLLLRLTRVRRAFEVNPSMAREATRRFVASRNRDQATAS